MPLEDLEVDRRSLARALKAIGESFGVGVQGAVLGEAFRVSDLQAHVLDHATLKGGDQSAREATLSALRRILANRCVDTDFPEKAKLSDVCGESPMALLRALSGDGWRNLLTIELDRLGRIGGIVAVIALMTSFAAVVLSEWNGLLFALAVLLVAIGGVVYLPGAYRNNATVGDLADDMLAHNAAKVVEDGATLSDDDVEMIIRSVLAWRLSSSKRPIAREALSPETVIRTDPSPISFRRRI